MQRKIKWIFLAMFFFSLSVAITGYINSSFIESLGWSNSIISGVYILSSLSVLFILPHIAKFTQRMSNRKLMLLFLSGSLISLSLIIFDSHPLVQLVSFLSYLILNFLIIFEMDIFVNNFSDKKTTGRIRGIFFTIINFTWAISPLAAGTILERFNNESIVYIVGIICVGITFSIFFTNFEKDTFKKSLSQSFISKYRTLLNNRDLKNVFCVSTMLHLVYASTMIYIPLHMHIIIGLSWVEIGFILLVGNIPFLILGFPIGYIADNFIGEKEMMIFGLTIASLGTLGFAFISEPQIISWAIVFFISRIGISIMETTSESYIFKKIKRGDIEILSMERNAVPLGYLLAPLIGFTVSLFTDRYEVIFIIIAILLTMTIYPALRLKDTK